VIGRLTLGPVFLIDLLGEKGQPHNGPVHPAGINLYTNDRRTRYFCLVQIGFYTALWYNTMLDFLKLSDKIQFNYKLVS